MADYINISSTRQASREASKTKHAHGQVVISKPISNIINSKSNNNKDRRR